MRAGISLYIALLFLGSTAFSQTVLTNCTETTLADALRRGGTITFDCDGVVSLSRSILLSNVTATLDASGRQITLDGQSSNRIFLITSSTVTVVNASFVNGRSLGAQGVASFNQAERRSSEPGVGGALLISNSYVRLMNCIFSNNVAEGGHAATAISNSQATVVSGAPAFGGSICAMNSDIFLSRCEHVQSKALGGIGRRGFNDATTGGGDAFGGALFASNSTVSVWDSAYVASSAVGAFSGFSTGAGQGAGGAVASIGSAVLIRNSFFLSNSAIGGTTQKGPANDAKGGAAFFIGSQAVHIENSSFVSNRIEALGNGGNASGGALYVETETAIDKCTFVGNQGVAGTSSTYSAPGLGFGGAVAAFGALNVFNCTLSLNRIVGGDWQIYGRGAGDAYGGAIFSGSRLSLGFSTVASNSATGGGHPWVPVTPGRAFSGGVFATNTMTLSSSVLSGNAPTNFSATFVPLREAIPPLTRPTNLVDLGGNISSDYSLPLTHPTSLSATDPKLGPLRYLRDFHAFFPLASNSPAIDRAAHLAAEADQLGFPRRIPDSGAIEWQGNEARLEIVTEGNSLLLSFFDPEYRFELVEHSSNLVNWSPLVFKSYAPVRWEPVGSVGFFRVKAR